jgi:hypothetical protein
LGARTVEHAIPDLPGQLDNYYVPRGYAVVLGQSVGTADSDGCPTSGDMAETLGTKAIIVFKAGRRIGVVVLSSDQEYTLLPLGGTELTVAPSRSELTLPVVGGRSALRF